MSGTTNSQEQPRFGHVAQQPMAQPNGRVQPQAVDMEEAVLGAALLQKDALGRVMDIVRPEMFYRESNKIIYETMLRLFSDSQPIDLLTVKDALKSSGKLKAAGGAFFLAELTSRVASSANIDYHARVIVEKHILRELIRISSVAAEKAFDDTSDVFELLDEAERDFFALSDGAVRKNYATMATLYRAQMERIEAMRKQESGLTGLPTGYASLDKLTAGWQPTDLIVIAARPAMGKSAVMLNIAARLAEFQHAVAIFSLEMSDRQLMDRITCLMLEMPSDKLKRGELDDTDMKRMLRESGRITSLPIYIDDTGGISILDIRAKCRRLKAEKGIRMVIVDYLQLIKGSTAKGGNREQEIAHISRSLKEMAKELDITVIALSQLSRAVESRAGDKRPMLSDLRESGAIEQDADMVMFLHRPEYYGIETDADGNSTEGLMTMIFAKYRNGDTCDVPMRFAKWCGKVTEGDGNYLPNPSQLGTIVLPPTNEKIPF